MTELARDMTPRLRARGLGPRYLRTPAPQPGTQARPERPLAKAPSTDSGRVVSVDAVRGLSMICIIGADGVANALSDVAGDQSGFFRSIGRFVGNQFTHVDWAGIRFYDFVFPLFVFITGVSIVFSLSRLVEREGKARAHARVLRRALLLYVLGLIYYGGVSHGWSDVRLLGVLQRIAICYLFASIMFINLRPRGLVAAALVLLVGYWALMTFVPVPDVGAGSFVQGANLAYWIDAQYLPGRLWDETSDPEGLLSTLPAIATCLLGVFAGMLLSDKRLEPQQKSVWLVGAGLTMVAAGYLWSFQFPLIKYLWTSSFVLVTGGYGFILLGAMHEIVDVRGWKAWATALIWVGANAITLYLLNQLAGYYDAASRLVGGDVSRFLDEHFVLGTGNLLNAAVGLALAVALAGFLYRRKVFLRV